MRLLSTETWTMKEFLSDDQVPRYAILSHTWEDEEVNYQHWESGDFSTCRKGYDKIKKFGEQAARDGFEWVWADTCCIDKKSSAELTEAVNAMFRWYQKAAVCYVYFADVAWSGDTSIMNERLRHSRWFTRGWTLQELIAPRNISFYSADWMFIATKEQLCYALSPITGIDRRILKGTAELEDISIARRMSWASRRQTTRIEDRAYSLLGIFSVNLPLIYGEGQKAFRRLQEAIMNTTHDQSLFAWGRLVDKPSSSIDKDQELGRKPIPWKPVHLREKLLGLFATSPEDFRFSGDIAPVDHSFAHDVNRRRPPTVVNGGALMDMVIYRTFTTASYWDSPEVAQPAEAELALLVCRIGISGSTLVGLVLHSWGDNYCSRTPELVRVECFVSNVRFKGWTRTRHLIPYRPFRLRHGDILVRRWKTAYNCIGVERPTTKSGPAWRQKWQDKVLRLEEDAVGDEEMLFFFETDKTRGVTVTLRRRGKRRNPLGPLLIGVSPYITSGSIVDAGMEEPNMVPAHGNSFRSPAFYRSMTIPEDVWELEVVGAPNIWAKVERMQLDAYGEVDVLDFAIMPPVTPFQTIDWESFPQTNSSVSAEQTHLQLRTRRRRVSGFTDET